MKIYLNLPGGPYGVGLLAKIKELGYDGIRHDAPVSAERLKDSAEELEEVGLDAIWLIAGGTMTDERGAPLTSDLICWHASLVEDTLFGRRGGKKLVEIGNEPDLAHPFWRERPEELAELVSRIANGLVFIPVLSPSISNLNRRGFAYLHRMLPHLSWNVEAAVHRYPASHRWESSHVGRARDEELVQLKQELGTRHFWITETGWSEGPHDTCFGLRRITLSESEIGDRLAREIAWWRAAGAEAMVVYQVNDGPDRTNPLHRFGARRIDGTWKPWADVRRLTAEPNQRSDDGRN